MSIHMHANIIQQKAPRPDEQSALGQKTRLIISLSRFRFLLPSQHTSVCKARGANPFRISTIKASLTLARQATARSFSWLTSSNMKTQRQSKFSLVHVHHTQIFQTIFIQFPPEFCCPNALQCFGTLWYIP